MRKTTYLLNFLFFVCIAALISCNEDPADSSKEDDKVIWIKADDIQGSTLNLERNTSFTIRLNLYPEGAIDKEEYTFQYKSSNEAIATVSEEGVITAIKVGETTINVIPSHNSKLGFAFTVNVVAGKVSVENITLSEDIKNGIVIESPGQTFNLSEHVIVTPEDATNPNVTYSIDKEEVAEIDEFGIIKALAPGTATITITSSENPIITIFAALEVKDIPIKVPVTLNRENWVVTESYEYLTLSGDETAEIVRNRVVDGDVTSTIKFDKPGKGNRPLDDTNNSYFVIDRNSQNEFLSFRVIQPEGKNSRACVTAVTIYGKDSDSGAWEVIKENVSIPNSDTAGSDSGEIDLKGSTAHTYRYIKVEITSWNTQSSSTTEMAEFYLIGYEE